MKRMIWMAALGAAPAALAADAPLPCASTTPPSTVWPDAGRTMPVLQPAPLPGVPAPSATTLPKADGEAAPKPVPAPLSTSGLPQLVPQSVPPMNFTTTPLPLLLSTPLPTMPSVPPFQSGPADCASESCGPTVRGSRLTRFCNWLTFQPGPAVLPTCEPARYQVPLRYYFPCVAGANCGANGNCAPGAGGHVAGGLGANLGGRLNGGLRGLISPAGYGGGSGGVLGPIAGGCGTPGLISGGGPLGNLASLGSGCNSDGCVNIKNKGVGVCSEPSDAAPVTGPICLTTQAVGVPLPAACVGSPADYTGCYAGCDTVGSACRAGAGGRLLGLVFGTCHGGCSQVAQGGNGFAPTSIVPVVTGYARPQTGKYRYADPLSNINPTPVFPGQSNPQLGQPNVDGIGPGLMQSGHTNPAKPFSRP